MKLILCDILKLQRHCVSCYLQYLHYYRRDNAFLSALEAGNSDALRVRGGHDDNICYNGAQVGKFLSGTLGRCKVEMSDDATSQEKLINMGKTSKGKFTNLGCLFSRRKGEQQQQSGHEPTPSKKIS